MTDAERQRLEALIARRTNVATIVPYEVGKSSLGAISLIGDDEDWPGEDEDWPGRPELLAPLLQINVAELPARPELLADVEHLCLWLAPDDLPNGAPNGVGWEVRAYGRESRLQTIDRMPIDGPVAPHGLRFEASIDFPDWDDASSILERAGIQ